MIAKNGPKIQPSKPGDTYPNGIKGLDGLPAGPHKFDFGPDGLIVQALPMSFVTNNLAMHLKQPVVDRTGLTGDYDFTLRFSPEGETAVHNHEQTGAKAMTMPVTSISAHNAALLKAIEEQLSLAVYTPDAYRTTAVPTGRHRLSFAPWRRNPPRSRAWRRRSTWVSAGR